MATFAEYLRYHAPPGTRSVFDSTAVIGVPKPLGNGAITVRDIFAGIVRDE